MQQTNTNETSEKEWNPFTQSTLSMTIEESDSGISDVDYESSTTEVEDQRFHHSGSFGVWPRRSADLDSESEEEFFLPAGITDWEDDSEMSRKKSLRGTISPAPQWRMNQFDLFQRKQKPLTDEIWNNPAYFQNAHRSLSHSTSDSEQILSSRKPAASPSKFHAPSRRFGPSASFGPTDPIRKPKLSKNLSNPDGLLAVPRSSDQTRSPDQSRSSPKASTRPVRIPSRPPSQEMSPTPVRTRERAMSTDDDSNSGYTSAPTTGSHSRYPMEQFLSSSPESDPSPGFISSSRYVSSHDGMDASVFAPLPAQYFNLPSKNGVNQMPFASPFSQVADSPVGAVKVRPNSGYITAHPRSPKWEYSAREKKSRWKVKAVPTMSPPGVDVASFPKILTKVPGKLEILDSPEIPPKIPQVPKESLKPAVREPVKPVNSVNVSVNSPVDAKMSTNETSRDYEATNSTKIPANSPMKISGNLPENIPATSKTFSGINSTLENDEKKKKEKEKKEKKQEKIIKATQWEYVITEGEDSLSETTTPKTSDVEEDYSNYERKKHRKIVKKHKEKIVIREPLIPVVELPKTSPRKVEEIRRPAQELQEPPVELEDENKVQISS
eukprot:TRINITY_DN1074_c0_g1_i1.p1 TRINITY_DN1074_c0_g1~~TRINITY_DN1074_c0_g1_i1.p1  ORF type:complete len:609 (+),score=171.50 TRINITY_DN1074_c0_g1_i1:461-2287(+)